MREPLRFSGKHWWNIVMVLIVVAGIWLWRAGELDGRVAFAASLLWVLAGWFLSPSILYEHLGFLDRHVFNDYGKAIDRYRKAVDTGRATLEGKAALASLSYAEGDVLEASRLLEEITSIVPGDPYLHSLHSRALSKLGRHEDAVSVAMKCGEGPLGQIALGDALKAKGQMSEAASAYKRAALSVPGLPEPHVGLAEAYLAMGESRAARKEAEAALASAPKDPDALYWTGKTTEASGDPGSAGKFYRSALTVRPIGNQSYDVTYKELVKAVCDESLQKNTGSGGPGT